MGITAKTPVRTTSNSQGGEVNGQLVIIRDGKTYNVMGAIVR